MYAKAEDLTRLGDPIVVVTFQRSGTHLMIDLLRKQFAACASRKRLGAHLSALYTPIDYLRPEHGYTADVLWAGLRAGNRPICKSHYDQPGFPKLAQSEPALAEHLNTRGTVFYVIRDPRAVMCSTYEFLQFKDRVKDSSTNTFLAEFLPTWRRHVELWASHSNTQVFRFEDLVKKTEESLQRLSTLLGEEPLGVKPLLPGRLGSRWMGWYKRFFCTTSESTEILTQRKPKPWQTFFTREDLDFIEAEVGELLRLYKYEEDSAWVERVEKSA